MSTSSLTRPILVRLLLLCAVISAVVSVVPTPSLGFTAFSKFESPLKQETVLKLMTER